MFNTDVFQKLQTNLRGLGRHLQKSGSAWRPHDYVFQLLECCDWSRNQDLYKISEQPIYRDNGVGRYSATIAGQPSFVVTIPDDRQPNWDSLFESSRNFAFNRGIRWSVVSNFYSTYVLDNQWSSPKPFLEIKDARYLERIDDVYYLTPHAFVDRAILRKSKSAMPPGVREIPIVPEILFKHFREWRDEVIKVINPKPVDLPKIEEEIHLLLNCMVFMRCCEGRGILPRYYLREIIQNGSRGCKARLESKLAELAERFNSELFQDVHVPRGSSDLIPPIIRLLYGYPEYRLEYNFGDMDSNILGALYEQYLKYTPIEVSTDESSGQLPLFTSHEVRSAKRQQEQGIYYTPPFIVEYIVRHTVKEFVKSDSSTQTPPCILDLACGSGIFLAHALEVLREHYRPQSDKDLVSLAKSGLFGIDENPMAVRDAQLQLWLELIACGFALDSGLPNLSDNIVQGDTLIDLYDDASRRELNAIPANTTSRRLDTFKELTTPESYDIIVGNPPYVSIENLLRHYEDENIREAKRSYYESAYHPIATGRYDLSWLFLCRAIQLLKPGGYLGMIVNNRFMTNEQAEPLRAYLRHHLDIIKIIDFTDQQVFHVSQGTKPTVYTCILLGRKRKPSRRYVSVGRVNLLLREFPSLQLHKIDTGQLNSDPTVEAFRAPLPATGPWILVPDRDAELKLFLESPGHSLPEQWLFQGIWSGADDVFRLKAIEEYDDTVRVHSDLLPSPFEIEKDVVKPFLRGEDIERFDINFRDYYLIYPYDDNGLWDEDKLRTHERAWGYLSHESVRPILGRRQSIRNSNVPFYALVRPRDYNKVFHPKILIGRTVSERLKFAVDEEGRFALGRATGVIPGEVSVNALCALVNSSLYYWYLAKVGQLQAGGAISTEQKFLKMLPLPNQIYDQNSEAVRTLESHYIRLKELYSRQEEMYSQANIFQRTQFHAELYALEQANDELVFALFDLNSEQRQVIHDFFKQRDRLKAVSFMLA